jgi:ketosteroid isomerase-like protein
LNQPHFFGRRDKLALLDRMVRARETRDYRVQAESFAPDAVFWLIGSPAHTSFSGRRVGRDNLMQAIRLFDAEFRQYDVAIEPVIIDGDQAAFPFSMTIEPRGGGAKATRVRFLIHLKFGDWFVTEFTVFTDTAMVMELVRGE